MNQPSVNELTSLPPDQVNDLAVAKIIQSYDDGKFGHANAPFPIWCPVCKGFGPAAVIDSDTKEIHFSCDSAHHEYLWPVPKMECAIQASTFSRVGPSVAVDRLAVSAPSLHVIWANSRILVSKGYHHPLDLFPHVAQTLPSRNVPLNRHQSRVLLMAQNWGLMPRFFTIDPALAWDKDLPEQYLEEIPRHFVNGAFVLPHPFELGFLGFAVVKAGFHTFRQGEPDFFTPVDVLILWMVFPENGFQISAEITLRGRSLDFEIVGSFPEEYKPGLFHDAPALGLGTEKGGLSLERVNTPTLRAFVQSRISKSNPSHPAKSRWRAAICAFSDLEHLEIGCWAKICVGSNEMCVLSWLREP